MTLTAKAGAHVICVENNMNEQPQTEETQAEARARVARISFCGVFVAGLVTVLGFRRTNGVAAASCRKKSDRCDRSDQCCSNRCRRGFCYPRRRK